MFYDFFLVRCECGHHFPWFNRCSGCIYLTKQYPHVYNRASRIHDMLSPRIIDKDSRNRVERALRGENSLPKGDKPLDWVLNRNESKGPLEEAILRFFLFDEIPDELSGQKPRRVERPIEEKCRGKATPF